MEGEERLHQVFLGLGSNLGHREEHIRYAIQLIGERVGVVARQSTLIETEPWGFKSENKFLNGVVLCKTEKTPLQVLNETQKIERELGRKEKTIHSPSSSFSYKDRPIDIDILLYDDLRIDEPDLKIPHPLMYERSFVMTPLNEIINI